MEEEGKSKGGNKFRDESKQGWEGKGVDVGERKGGKGREGMRALPLLRKRKEGEGRGGIGGEERGFAGPMSNCFLRACSVMCTVCD